MVESGEEAWPDFLDCYSSFILACIRRFARNHDERMEIYTHVCQRLAEDDCRRIRQFRGTSERGTCKFSTWLAAVVFNLSREWIRSARGRRRLYRSLTDLTRTDRLIFRWYFWEGYSCAEISHLLAAKEHISCSVIDVVERLGTIERRLNRDQRWRLVTALLRAGGPVSIDRPGASVGDSLPFELPDDRPERQNDVCSAEAHRTLRRLIDGLPEDERLAVRMRFERGLAAREIALALGIANYKKVYEIQGRALERLEQGLSRRGFEFRDFVDRSTGLVKLPE